jgi:acetyl esterase/lipase
VFAKLRSLGLVVPVFASALLIADALPVAEAQDASKYYTVQHPDQFKIDWGAFYKQADAMTTAVRAEFPHYLDLPYGPNVKQRLDVYLPKNKPGKAAVFLFFHGGGFREGDRAQYGFVAKPFAEHGLITVVASYRLTGDGFKYPDQPQDARLALAWVYKQIAKYGGDPDRLYVGGHSAGGILAADLGVNRKWMKSAGIAERALRGIVPISGPYDLRTPGRAGEDDAYAPTAELLAQASPLLHIDDPAPMAVIAVGSTESYVASSQSLATQLTAAGAHATFLSLEGEDHRATVHDIGDGNSALFRAVIDMITAAPATSR